MDTNLLINSNFIFVIVNDIVKSNVTLNLVVLIIIIIVFS